MKLVVPVRLYPGASQEAALRDTLALCNQAADLVSAQAFRMRVTSKQSLQRMVYGDLKAMGLSAQPAIHVARKVSGAYTTLRANVRAGNLGDPGSKHRVKAGAKPITFRADAAQPFDDRCLSWQLDRGTVSIWTTAGRLRDVRFACSPAQMTRLREYRQGESDLVHRDGKWFLYATCDIPGPAVTDPGGFLGVDLGIANIATTDDGTRHCGKCLNRQRHRARHLRAKLQAKNTKSAKRLLKKRARKEARFAAGTNHVIAKRIVTEAERTGRGIALEDLTGIRARVRLRKPQRVTLRGRAGVFDVDDWHAGQPSAGRHQLAPDHLLPLQDAGHRVAVYQQADVGGRQARVGQRHPDRVRSERADRRIRVLPERGDPHPDHIHLSHRVLRPIS